MGTASPPSVFAVLVLRGLSCRKMYVSMHVCSLLMVERMLPYPATSPFTWTCLALRTSLSPSMASRSSRTWASLVLVTSCVAACDLATHMPMDKKLTECDYIVCLPPR